MDEVQIPKIYIGDGMKEIFHEFMVVLGQPMAIVGLVGQAVFSSRFLVQWIVSEKEKKSVIPNSFWFLSIAGSAMTLVYAIWRRDPVFTLAQSFGMVVYVRNIMLIRQHKIMQVGSNGIEV